NCRVGPVHPRPVITPKGVMMMTGPRCARPVGWTDIGTTANFRLQPSAAFAGGRVAQTQTAFAHRFTLEAGCRHGGESPQQRHVTWLSARSRLAVAHSVLTVGDKHPRQNAQDDCWSPSAFRRRSRTLDGQSPSATV